MSYPPQSSSGQVYGGNNPQGDGGGPPPHYGTNNNQAASVPPSDDARQQDCCVCCFCFSDGPTERDSMKTGRSFQSPMCNTVCNNPGCLCISLLCLPCAICWARKAVLEDDMTQYKCCQGYYDDMIACCTCGMMRDGCGQSCPPLCLCCEVWCCPGISISSSRFWIMDSEGLRSDPCDRRLIVFNNCVQCLACICWYGARLGIDICEQFYQLVMCFADIVFCMTAGCMVAQVDYELKHIHSQGRKLAPPVSFRGPPPKQAMT